MGTEHDGVHARIGETLFRTTIEARQHSVFADEPQTLGGADKGFRPFELLLASLGSCTAITMKMYAARKGWNLTQAVVRVEMDYERDKTTHIRRHITLIGDLDAAQRERLMQIAEACPTHKLLTHPIEIETNIEPIEQQSIE